MSHHRPLKIIRTPWYKIHADELMLLFGMIVVFLIGSMAWLYLDKIEGMLR